MFADYTVQHEAVGSIWFKANWLTFLKWLAPSLISPPRPVGVSRVALQKHRCSVSWVMQPSSGLIPECWHRCGTNISKQSCSTSVCSCASTFVKSCHQVADTGLKNLLVITSRTSGDSHIHECAFARTHTQRWKEGCNNLSRTQTATEHISEHVCTKHIWRKTHGLLITFPPVGSVWAGEYGAISAPALPSLTRQHNWSGYLPVVKGFLMIFLHANNDSQDYRAE